MALTKKKGVDGHSKAHSHINAEKDWGEHVARKNKVGVSMLRARKNKLGVSMLRGRTSLG